MNEAPANSLELVSIFPLPEAVLFPRQLLPLHVFEPRYRTLVADALAGEMRIAIALLKPNYERQYFTSRAPIHQMVGVGRVVAAEELPGGRFNILLRGEARANLLEEIPGRPYRLARVRTARPRCNATSAARTQLRGELLQAIRQQSAVESEACEHYLQLFEAPLSLGELADLIAGTLPIIGELRQCLLAELEVCTRAKMLLEHIHTLGSITPHARCAARRTEWSRN